MSHSEHRQGEAFIAQRHLLLPDSFNDSFKVPKEAVSTGLNVNSPCTVPKAFCWTDRRWFPLAFLPSTSISLLHNRHQATDVQTLKSAGSEICQIQCPSVTGTLKFPWKGPAGYFADMGIVLRANE